MLLDILHQTKIDLGGGTGNTSSTMKPPQSVWVRLQMLSLKQTQQFKSFGFNSDVSISRFLCFQKDSSGCSQEKCWMRRFEWRMLFFLAKPKRALDQMMSLFEPDQWEPNRTWWPDPDQSISLPESAAIVWASRAPPQMASEENVTWDSGDALWLFWERG